MNLRVNSLFFLLCLVFISLDLNAGNHAAYSKNSAFIDAAEEAILNSLETNPARSDSLASVLFTMFGGQDVYAEGIANYYRGEVAYSQQKWSDAEAFYRLALTRFTKAGAQPLMASASNNLGLVLYYTGQYDKALEAISRSLSLELNLKNEKGIAQSYQNMGLIFEEMGQLPKAVAFYMEALDVFIELNNWEDAAGIYNNLGAIFANDSDFDQAESYYLKALDIYNEQNLSIKQASVQCNIGVLMIRKGDFPKGGKMLEQALVLMKSNGDKMGEVSVYNHLGDLYAAREEFQQAVFLYKTALSGAVELESTDLRLHNLFSLYLVYKQAELFEDALATHESYQELRDSVLTANPIYKQAILNQELEQQLSNRELQNYKAAVREKAYWIILGGFLLMASLVVLYLLKRRRKVENLINQHNFGRRFIDSQMDTHFVFSMLSSLQGHIISGNNDLALDHLNNVAALLRKIFENSGKGLIPLSQEIDFLHAYFSVQNQRFNKDIRFSIESNIASSDGTVLVPFMVTKPFIESAITNGLFNCQEHPRFNIAFMRLGSRLEVTIEDNGPVKGTFENLNLEERLKNIGIPMEDGKLFSALNRSNQYAISDVKVEDRSQTGMGSGTRVRFSFPLVTTN